MRTPPTDSGRLLGPVKQSRNEKLLERRGMRADSPPDTPCGCLPATPPLPHAATRQPCPRCRLQDMREKRLPQADADAGDEQEEPTKRPRTRFVELQPAADDPGGRAVRWPMLLVGSDVDAACIPAAPVLCRAMPCHCAVTPRRFVLSHAHGHAMHVCSLQGRGYDHGPAAMACHLTPCYALHMSSNSQQLNYGSGSSQPCSGCHR